MRANFPIPRFRRLIIGLWVLLTLPHLACADGLSTLKEKIIVLMEAEKIGAVAYGVVSRENILAQEAIGYYGNKDPRPVSPESLFRIGSISKTFTALGAIALEEKTNFQLSQPITKYLSHVPYENLWSNEFPISVMHLLEHTAGFRDLSRQEFDQLTPLPLADAFRLAPQSRITAWPPGHHSSYSNSGAGVATAVLETVSGQPFEDFMQHNVFQPLQLHSASFSPPTNMYQELVRGYDTDGETAIPYWHQLYPAFGALNISTHDMLQFVRFLLNDGRIAGQQIFPRRLIKNIATPTTTLAARAGLHYGYGKGAYQFQHNGLSFYGHGGDADGYLAFFGYSPRLNLGYFAVINAYQQNSLKRIRELIQDFMVAGEQATFPKPASLPVFARGDLFGEYEEVTTRFVSNAAAKRLEIFSDDKDQIYTRLEGAKKQLLIPVSAHLFRRRWHSVATAAFIKVDEEIYLQGGFGNFKKIRLQSKLGR